MTAQTGTHPVTYGEAVLEALREEARRDSRIFVIGYYLPNMIFGYYGAEPLMGELGEDRFMSSPVTECSMAGAAVGAAMMGLRPVVDLMAPNFAYYATDQLINQAAKQRYTSGGQFSVPAVFVLHYGARRSGTHHNDRSHPMYVQVPGLQVLAPCTPYDAKGLFKSALRSEDPVIFFLDNIPGERFGGRHQQIPDEEYLVPIGSAVVRREGKDITVVPICWLHQTMEAVTQLEQEGISAEVVEPRTLKPLDVASIIRSVAKTGRLVVVDSASPHSGTASEVAAVVTEEAFSYLKAPILRVTAPDVHVGFSAALDDAAWPSKERIVAAIKRCLSYQR
ncbi:MAG: alpha-ketoacid dehydrogenase subunit beta [Deltaproteobacteria bacterium]|nr:alpha-ketoacid dehydrogenase subunit beta [Deltaproteobacteria bacterium]